MRVSGIPSGFNLSFKAGVVNLLSDYDGTFIPEQFSHDSIVKNTPFVDKFSFKTYFDDFSDLLKKIRGDKPESKLNFSITTGRNLHEFNYHLQKIRDNGLSVPLPDSVITCNGQDEFFRRSDYTGFFDGSVDVPFLPKDVNHAKRRWVKYKSGGWDGELIRKNLINELLKVNIVPNSDSRDSLLERINPFKDKTKATSWIYDLFEKKRTQDELRIHLEESAKPLLETMQNSERDDFLLSIQRLAKEIDEIKNGKYKFSILSPQTNRCNKSYPYSGTLQSHLEAIRPVPKFYASIRDDGNLGFQIAYPWVINHKSDAVKDVSVMLPKIRTFGDRPDKTFAKKLTSALIQICDNFPDGEAFNVNGDKTAGLRIRPIIQGHCSGPLDKKHDIFLRLKEIMDKGLDDLIIVAGDGSNDVEMLKLQNYVPNFNPSNPESIAKLRKLPIISIFVQNNDIKGFSPVLQENFLNADGQVRFIRVIPNNNIGKPKTLQEGILSAIAEYSSRNEKFAAGLSQEIKDTLAKSDYRYSSFGKNLPSVAPSVISDSEIKHIHKPKTQSVDFTNKLKNFFSQNKKILLATTLVAVGITTLLLLAKKTKLLSGLSSKKQNVKVDDSTKKQLSSCIDTYISINDFGKRFTSES